MPWTKEQQTEYNKQYKQNNKERIAVQTRQYRQEHKEKIAEINRQYRQNHEEHIAEYLKRYNQTPQGKMSNRISKWKQRGIKLPDDYGDNWEIFYEAEYMATTHCDECNVELTEDKQNTSTTRVLDHCHRTGEFRNILCHACNVKRS